MSSKNGKSRNIDDEELYDESPERDMDDNDDILSDLDFPRIINIFRKNALLLLFIIITCLASGYIYLRYTKPVYESSSSLRLSVKRQANVLGINGLSDDSYGNLQGEIELIKSNLIYDEVIKKMNLSVSYFIHGKIIDEERYNSNPFKVEYKIINELYYDVPFDLQVKNENQFILKYKNTANQEVSETYQFNTPVKTGEFELTITKKKEIADFLDVKFYFIINSNFQLNNYLAKNLRVEILNPNANIIGIYFKDNSVNKARDIVNTVDSVYLYKTIEEKDKSSIQKIEFMDQQLIKIEDSLDVYEKKLLAFPIQERGIDKSGNTERNILKIEELLDKRLQLGAQYSQTKTLKELVEKNYKINEFLPTAETITDPQINGLLNSVSRLLEEKEMLSISTKDNTFSSKVKDKELQIAKTRLIFLLGQSATSIREKINKINEKVAKLEGETIHTPDNNQYTKVRRFKDLYEKFYLQMMDRKAEIGISKAGTIPDFVILSPANIPRMAISPNKIFIYLICGGIGILISILIVVISYFLHNTISSQKDLDRIALSPVLGIVPTFLKEKMLVSRLVVDKFPKSSISEALRAVRTNMDFMSNARKSKKIISVSSSISGEGKTFVSMNLAGIIALSNVKVIILDLDMRKPRLHLGLDSDNMVGISTILIGKNDWKDCVNHTSIPNLDFITAGPIPPNPAELILRPEFDELLQQLHEKYDVIVIDTPPVGLVTDGILTMKKSDMQVFVVRADYSKRVFVKNINKLIKNHNFRRSAIILNALKTTGKNGYGYGYGYGNGYYDSDEVQNPLIRRIERPRQKRSKKIMFSFFKKKPILKETIGGLLVTDMHSHLLPGIDDGAGTIQDSITMIEGLMLSGYRKFIATPHIMNDFYPNTPEIIFEKLDELKKELKDRDINVEIEAAAEYYLDEWLMEKLNSDEKLIELRQ